MPLDEHTSRLSLREKLQELDPLGATVGITAMILFNFAWNQAPGFGWEQPYIYATLIVGLLLFPVFFWIEARVSKRPLIPFAALSTDVTFVLTCMACGWASFGKCLPVLCISIAQDTDISKGFGSTISSSSSNGYGVTRRL